MDPWIITAGDPIAELKLGGSAWGLIEKAIIAYFNELLLMVD